MVPIVCAVSVVIAPIRRICSHACLTFLFLLLLYLHLILVSIVLVIEIQIGVGVVEVVCRRLNILAVRVLWWGSGTIVV